MFPEYIKTGRCSPGSWWALHPTIANKMVIDNIFGCREGNSWNTGLMGAGRTELL